MLTLNEGTLATAFVRAVFELVNVPTKFESVETCSVYESPTGDGAVHDAVKELTVALVNTKLVGAGVTVVNVLPKNVNAVEIPE